jgi:hypothetical protein
MNMANSATKSTNREILAPSLAPHDFVAILQEADALLALMSSEPLEVVADLANTLSVSANGAEAWEIAEAANAVRRMASGHQAAMLTGAMRNLTEAIARAQHDYRLER